MEQQDQPVSTESTPSPAPSNKMRMIAVAATAIALLAIAIPFVWEPHVDAQPSATEAAVTPAASHEVGSAQTPACMADAKPANWEFKLKDLEGKDVALSSFKGKVVLLNFWATWCGPCKAEIPGFVELQEKYRDKLTIVGYSVDDTAELAKKYAAEYKMNYPILLGEGREDVQDAYGPIWGIPASFLISKDGKVCRKHMGIAPKAVFEKEIVALLE
ncbi:MAG TPA: TlpA disulfide reductase family protein [Vicinamibacterales bacterium]|jgi:thiol-disulfide isomerase/thioredoxin